VERLLFLVAAACLGYYVYVTAESYLYQAYENRELDEILNSRLSDTEQPGVSPNTPSAETTPAPDSVSPTAPAPRPRSGSIIGRIEIPRLGVSAIVRSGSDAKTLRLAVGHIPGTALPGESGNVGLAGHRDTFFRKLGDIRPDDEIRITTINGIFRYRVDDTTIVQPADVWVLDPGDRPTVTLITCYPFTYIGSAPKRFIVRAVLNAPLNATH